MKDRFYSAFCEGPKQHLKFGKLLFSCFCSIRIALSLMFTISLISLGSVLISVFLSYSTSNVSLIFDESQRITIHHIEKMTTDWLENGPRLINVLFEFMEIKNRTNEIDLLFASNETNWREKYQVLQEYLYLIYQANDIGSIFFISHQGTGSGVANAKNRFFSGMRFTDPYLSTNCPVIVDSITRNYDSCPYTLAELKEGNRTDIPGRGYHINLGEKFVYLSEPFKFGPKHVDSRLHPWYKTAALDPDPSSVRWNTQYSNAKIFKLTVSKKFFSNDEFIGVAQVSYFLKTFKVFIDSLALERGNLYLINGENGFLLGTNDEDLEISEIGEKHSTGSLEPQLMKNIKGEIIEAIYEYFVSQHSDLSYITRITQEEIDINGDTYLLEAKQFKITGDFFILIIYVASKDEIFSDIYKGNITSISICVGFIFIFFSIISIISIYIILRPFVSLSNKLKRLEKLKFDKVKIRCLSVFKEIRNVQKRFRFCVLMLKEYSAFLPHYVKEENEKKIDKNKIKLILNPRRFLSQFIRGKEPSVINMQNSEIMNHNNNNNNNNSNDSNNSSNISSGSRSNSSGNSSCGSKGSSNSSVSTGKESIFSDKLFSPKPENKFGLCVTRNNIICLSLYLVNWRELLWNFPHSDSNSSSNSSDDDSNNNNSFSYLYSNFLTFILKKIKKQKCGHLYSFNINRIIIYYEKCESEKLIRQIMDISETVNTKRYKFQVAMILSSDITIMGVLGNKSQKRNILFKGALERNQFIFNNCFSLSSSSNNNNNSNNCSIFFDFEFEKELRRINYQNIIKYIPYNIFGQNNEEKEYIIVYEVIIDKDSLRKNTEWMYSLRRESKAKIDNAFLEAFHLIISNKVDEAICLLENMEEYFIQGKEEEEKEEEKEEGRDKISVGFLLKVLKEIEMEKYNDFFEFLDCRLLELKRRSFNFSKSLVFLDNNNEKKEEKEEKEENKEGGDNNNNNNPDLEFKINRLKNQNILLREKLEEIKKEKQKKKNDIFVFV